MWAWENAGMRGSSTSSRMGLYIPARPRRFAACASFGATEGLRPLLRPHHVPHRLFQRLIKAGDVQAVYQRVGGRVRRGEERLFALPKYFPQ